MKKEIAGIILIFYYHYANGDVTYERLNNAIKILSKEFKISEDVFHSCMKELFYEKEGKLNPMVNPEGVIMKVEELGKQNEKFKQALDKVITKVKEVISNG